MKVWNTGLFIALMTACNSPETKQVEMKFNDPVQEIKKKETTQPSNVEQNKVTSFILPNEKLVLSFKTNRKKQVFVCRDKDNKYLVYRFGSQEKIELQFPEKLDQSSFKKFDYSSYLRPGGPENLGMSLDYLAFTNSGYRYVIYKTYASESVGNEDEIGIRITQLKTNKETRIPGDFNTLEGGFPEETMGLVNQSEALYD